MLAGVGLFLAPRAVLQSSESNVMSCQFGVGVVTSISLFFTPGVSLNSSGGIVMSVPCWCADQYRFILHVASSLGGAAIVL